MAHYLRIVQQLVWTLKVLVNVSNAFLQITRNHTLYVVLSDLSMKEISSLMIS